MAQHHRTGSSGFVNPSVPANTRKQMVPNPDLENSRTALGSYTCHDSPQRGQPLSFGAIRYRHCRPHEFAGRELLAGHHIAPESRSDQGNFYHRSWTGVVTGKWDDIGKFKGPIPRGLSARAPYFHNGSAASLKEVIEFYNIRFDMELTEREKADLVAFLRTL